MGEGYGRTNGVRWVRFLSIGEGSGAVQMGLPDGLPGRAEEIDRRQQLVVCGHERLQRMRD